MNSEQTSPDLIDAYLEGELAGEVLAQFEKKLQADPELAAFVRRQQRIREVAQGKDQRQMFLETLKSITRHDQLSWYERLWQRISGALRLPFANIPPAKSFRPIGWAVLLFIAGFSTWYIVDKVRHKPPPAPSEKGAATLFQLSKDAIPSTLMGDGKDSLKAEGVRLFADSLFAQAIPLFGKWLYGHPDDVTARLLLGISLKETGQPEASLAELQQVIDAEAADSDIAWLAMAEIYRSNNDPVRCRAVLLRIDSFTHSRPASRIRAKQILEEIGSETTK